MTVAIEERLAAQAQQEAAALTAPLPQLQSQPDDLRQQWRSTVMESDLPVDVLARLYELQQSAELARAQYQTLLARNSDLQVQADLQSPTAGSWRLQGGPCRLPVIGSPVDIIQQCLSDRSYERPGA